MLRKVFSVEKEKHQDIEHKVYKIFNVLKIKFKQKVNNKNYISSIRKQISTMEDTLKKQNKKIKELEKEQKLLRTIIEKSVDITKIPAATGSFRKVQLVKLEIIKAIDKIFKKNNVTYWLEYGTLIGAIRHKGFIPWDDDVDFAVLKSDYLRLPEIFKDEPEFDLKIGNNNGSEIIRIYYKNFCIDIFPMEYVQYRCNTNDEKLDYCNKWLQVKTEILQKYPLEKFKSREINHFDLIYMKEIQEIKDKVFNCKYNENIETKQIIRSVESMIKQSKCGVFNTDCIFPLKHIEFEGVMLPVPNDPIEHLYQANEYGAKGAVMSFPTIKDSGFAHTQRKFDNMENLLDETYKELQTLNNKQEY